MIKLLLEINLLFSTLLMDIKHNCIQAELSGVYGLSCPLPAELSMGRVVHGPSCPVTVIYMSNTLWIFR